MKNVLRRELESLPRNDSGKVTLYAVATQNAFREAAISGSTDPVNSFYLSANSAMLASHGTGKVIEPLVTDPASAAAIMKTGRLHQSVIHFELKNSIREAQDEYGFVLPPAQMADKIGSKFDDKMMTTPFYVPFKGNGQSALVEILEQGKADPSRIADTVLSSNSAKQYQNKLNLVNRNTDASRLLSAVLEFPEAYQNKVEPQSLMDEATVELNDVVVNGVPIGDIEVTYFYTNIFSSVEDNSFEHEVKSITFGVLDDNDKETIVTLTGEQAKLMEHLYVKNDGVEEKIKNEIVEQSPELSSASNNYSQNEINNANRDRQASYQR
jgi:hypothetical protein